MGLRGLYDGHPSPLDTKNIRDNLLSRQAALQRALHAVQHDMDVTPGQNTISFPMLLGSEQNSGISENLSQLPNFDSITLLSYKEASVLAGMPCIKSPDGNESIDLYFSASALDDITDTATGKKGFRSGNPMDVRVYARVHGSSTGGIDNFGMTYVDGGSYTLTTLYQTDGDTWWQLNAAGRHGQSFTVPASSNGKPLKSISLYMKQNGSPNGYVYVAIVGKSGDVPNTIPTEDITLWSNYVDTSSLSTSGGWVEFKFNGPLPKLVTGDVYQIRIFGDPSASVYLDISGAGYSGGNASHYDTGSSSWIADSGSDLYIAITHYGISTIYFWTDPSSYHKWQDVYVSATMIFNHGIYSEEGDADFKIHIPSEGALNAICILDTATRGMLHWRCGHVRTPHISIIQSGAATDGQVLMATGAGFAEWETLPIEEEMKRGVMFHDHSLVTVGSGSIARTVSTSQSHGFVAIKGSADNGDKFSNGCILKAGTYTFRVLGTKASGRGKLDWYVDGTKITSTPQDWYSASTVYEVENSVASVVISTDGYHKVEGLVNGKNASSSGYAIGLTAFWFVPSSD